MQAHRALRAHLHNGVEEAQPKQQLLEFPGPVAGTKKGWVAHGVGQVAAQQVGAQACMTGRQQRRCLQLGSAVRIIEQFA